MHACSFVSKLLCRQLNPASVPPSLSYEDPQRSFLQLLDTGTTIVNCIINNYLGSLLFKPHKYKSVFVVCVR
jgi:hypothetical protein